jgi:predicted transcriptional regulator
MAKLTNADRNRILARSLFVDAKQSFSQIAQTLTVSEKTISNYQTKDKAEGFDWLTLRASKYIHASQETKENMYSMFTGYMFDSLKEIRENENLSPAQKSDAIASLGDSFSKMGKVARQEDPEAYKLGIIKYTIETILSNIKEVIPKECMENIITKIYEIDEELTNVSI